MECTDVTGSRSVIDTSAAEKGAYRMSRFEIKDMRELPRRSQLSTKATEDMVALPYEFSHDEMLAKCWLARVVVVEKDRCQVG